MADHTPTKPELLARCALLRRFDRESLCAITACDMRQAEKFIAGDKVESIAGGYQLRADVASAALARLRAARPADEVALHTRAFTYYLTKLKQSASDARSLEDEDDCFYHLDVLFRLVGAQMEWQTLLDYTLAVRAVSPLRASHYRRLSLYEGYVAIRLQDYDRGEALLAELIGLADIELDVRVKALKGLADATLIRSHYGRSLEFHHQLEAAASEAGDQMYQGLALINIGLIYHELEQFDRALEYCERSLQIFHSQDDRVHEAHARYHIALNSMYLGRWADARAQSTKAAQLFETLGLDTFLGVVSWLQGYLQHILGDEPASEAAYLRALPLAESPQHGQPLLAMDAWLYLGFLYHTQGRWEAALQHYERALALATRLDRQHQISLIQYRQGQAYQEQGRLDEAQHAYQQAIDGIEALRGMTEEEDVKISLLGTVQQLYEAIVLLYFERGQPADAFHYVERARSRAFLDSLSKKATDFPAAVNQPIVTLNEVQSHLPEGTLLLEYFTIGVLPRGEHLINQIPSENTRLKAHLALPPQVLLFAITRSHCKVYSLKLDPNGLRPERGERYPGRHLLHGRLPQYLYEQLIAPAAHLLDGTDVLYLIPHGPLHYVPFTALNSASGEYFLRQDGPALAQAPSATILVRTCLNHPTVQTGEMLALGYNDLHGKQPLRYAEAEAQHIAKMLHGQAWVGAEPKSQRLFALGRQARWLHIASHASFNPDDPLSSTLYLGADDALSARAVIRELSLQVDLVTLSSCTSGISHVVPGDELLGLQRAFLYAGAPTVVCTRWEARDFIALLVMDRFYSSLQSGQTPAVALRDAQVTVREMTGPELSALFERWRAEGSPIATVLNKPALALREAQDAVREITGPELDASLKNWRAAGDHLTASLDQPVVLKSDPPDAHPFEDPLYWAPFMLIGLA